MSTDHTSYPTGLRTTPTRHRALRRRMAEPGIVVAPGCYDCVTARLVEVSGFDAAYVTGSGVSMSALGAPDMGALSFGEILDRVRRMLLTQKATRVRIAYVGPMPSDAARAKLREVRWLEGTSAALDARRPQTDDGVAAMLIDPIGLAIVFHAAGYEPEGVRKDLSRLIR